jgi:Ni/Co efflux regulator RcnB
MKSTAIVSFMVAMTLATSGVAVAQGNGDREDHGRHDQRGHQRDHDDHQGRGHDDERDQGRGAGPYHQFHRGERLPVEYRHRHYVVEDWRGHHLSPPPRGYHWVQTGSDYVLVAITTGIILQILLNN